MKIFFTTIIAVAGAGSLLAQEDGFESLFDGKTLEGWDGEEQFWSVEDGTITGQTTKENPVPFNKFIIWDGEVADFDLILEYKIEAGNSGIQIRSFKNANPKQVYSIQGYQADLDSARGWAGTNYGEGFGGVLAKRGQKVTLKPDKKDNVVEELGDAAGLQAKIKENEWNEYRVVAKGNVIQMFINGVLMSETIDERPNARADGLLAFQLHGGPPMKVQFKNIRLKKIASE